MIKHPALEKIKLGEMSPRAAESALTRIWKADPDAAPYIYTALRGLTWKLCVGAVTMPLADLRKWSLLIDRVARRAIQQPLVPEHAVYGYRMMALRDMFDLAWEHA